MPSFADGLIYIPSWNYIKVTIGESGSILPVYFFYLMLSGLILIAMVLCSRFKKNKALSRRDVLRNTVLAVLAAMVLLQIGSQQSFLTHRVQRFFHQTVDEKYTNLWGSPYRYVRFALVQTPQNCAGKLITDLNVQTTLEPYILKYFLYPHVDLLAETVSAECLIVFRKNNPEQSVPDNYRIVGQFDEQSLIAVKRK